MGEYVRYGGEMVKIGTCECLYYTSYEKYVKALESGGLNAVEALSPGFYAKPDSGMLFRFPFPDEDNLPFGSIIEPFDRSVSITINQKDIPYDDGATDFLGATYQMELRFQKLVHKVADGELCLALVYRDPLKKETFRIEDDGEMKNIIKQIVRNHIANEPDLTKREFYRKIAARILKGYRIDIKNQVNLAEANLPAKVRWNKSVKRKGKGL